MEENWREGRKVTVVLGGGREGKEGSDSRRKWTGGGSQGNGPVLPGCLDTGSSLC